MTNDERREKATSVTSKAPASPARVGRFSTHPIDAHRSKLPVSSLPPRRSSLPPPSQPAHLHTFAQLLPECARTPPATSKFPAGVLDFPAGIPEIQAAVSGSPAGVLESPADVSEIPAGDSEIPACVSETPAEDARLVCRGQEGPTQATSTPVRYLPPIGCLAHEC